MISENARNYENVVIRNEQEIGINNFGLDYMVGLEEEIERLNNIIKKTREMLYKRDKDDYDTYTANVLCDIQCDFEEILRGEY